VLKLGSKDGCNEDWAEGLLVGMAEEVGLSDGWKLGWLDGWLDG